MSRPRGTKDSNEPIAWKAGQRAAREARALVAEQLAEELEGRDQTGSLQMVRRRAGELSLATRQGDLLLERGAAWELALAAAAYAASLDLAQTDGGKRQRRSRSAA